MAETISDTLAWYQALDSKAPLKAGLSAEREGPLPAEWHKNPDIEADLSRP